MQGQLESEKEERDRAIRAREMESNEREKVTEKYKKEMGELRES